MLRILVSLTTTKNNINYIDKTIDSIKNQTVKPNKIFITIPDYSNNKDKNISIPTKLINDKDIQIIKYEKDYGNLLNILGILLIEKNDNTLIITINDNYIYSKYLLEDLIKLHKKNPTAAIGFTGYIYGKNPFIYCSYENKISENKLFNTHEIDLNNNIGKKVDVLNNYSGILYKRSFFPKYEPYGELLKYINIDKSFLNINSDMLISGFLSKNKINRLLFKNNRVLKSLNSNNISNINKIKSIYNNFYKLKNKGMFTNNLICKKYYKTFSFSILMLFIFIIFFISVYISLNKYLYK
jgi:hypothetical protein